MKIPGLNEYAASRVQKLASIDFVESFCSGYGDGFLAGANLIESHSLVPEIEYEYHESRGSKYPFGYVMGVMEGIAWAKSEWSEHAIST